MSKLNEDIEKVRTLVQNDHHLTVRIIVEDYSWFWQEIWGEECSRQCALIHSAFQQGIFGKKVAILEHLIYQFSLSVTLSSSLW
jgi:hypothetical protein